MIQGGCPVCCSPIRQHRTTVHRFSWKVQTCGRFRTSAGRLCVAWLDRCYQQQRWATDWRL